VWELPLAFFRGDRYIVHTETGGVLVVVPDGESDALAVAGFEHVTKAELLERWPVWREEEERLLKQLGDTGSA
jgi:hypothetical protein